MAQLGEQITFTQKFTTSAGVDADPTTVSFFLREEVDGTELEWSMTGATGVVISTPTGMNAIVKDSTGDYHLAFTARKPERISAQWTGPGTVLVFAAETVFVRHSAIALLEP